LIDLKFLNQPDHIIIFFKLQGTESNRNHFMCEYYWYS